MLLKKFSLSVLLVAGISLASAATITIPMHITDESQTVVGSITATDTPYGVMFTPQLSKLTPELTVGVHGFHVHENPSCADNGMGAGGHLDPQKTKHHFGPYNTKGHLGDLPALYVNADGTVAVPVVAPRLKVSDLAGHSLMIHNGGDNYSDTPAPLGGGGKRMVCGVVPSK